MAISNEVGRETSSGFSRGDGDRSRRREKRAKYQEAVKIMMEVRQPQIKNLESDENHPRELRREAWETGSDVAAKIILAYLQKVAAVGVKREREQINFKCVPEAREREFYFPLKSEGGMRWQNQLSTAWSHRAGAQSESDVHFRTLVSQDESGRLRHPGKEQNANSAPVDGVGVTWSLQVQHKEEKNQKPASIRSEDSRQAKLEGGAFCLPVQPGSKRVNGKAILCQHGVGNAR